MSNNNYNYAIEKHLSQYGCEADKDITRTCGTCCAYDSVIAICNRDDEPENTIEATEQGCWYHMTHDERKRLEELVKQRQDEANRLHIEEQRRNGTGDCAGCPFRKMAAVLEKPLKECAPEMYAMLQKIIDNKIIPDYQAHVAQEIIKLLKKARGGE